MSSLAQRYKRRQSEMRAKSVVATGMNETLKRGDEVIYRFLEDRDVPPWFRGQSQFQLRAADELLNALRDDSEQRTTHRVLSCLDGIGVDPKISDKQATQLMHLSRGNDLAFLWFVMDLCYRTSGPDYSVNEQLLMSCMCHLDMITTLRELDRILPPAELSKYEWERRQHWAACDAARDRAEQRKRQRAAAAAMGAPKRTPALPYFEKQIRPRFYGHALTVSMPDFRVAFGSYAKYKNPDYKPPNEANRWYETYQLHPGKRIVNRILNDTMGDMFEDYERCLTKANNMEMLCEHHKLIREMEETLKAELQVVAREKCLEYINPEKRRQAERAARITKALDCEVKRFLYKFRVLANKSKQQMLIMSINSDEDCQYHTVDKSEVGWLDELEYEEEGGKCVGDMEGVEYASTTQHPSVASDTPAQKRNGSGNGNGGGGGDCMAVSTNGSTDSVQMNRRFSRGHVSIAETMNALVDNDKRKRPSFKQQNACTLNVANGVTSSMSSSSNSFFEANTAHKPYVFHYRKIFTFKEEPSEKVRLQQSVIQALLSDADLRKYAENSQMNVNKALDDLVDRQWCAGVKAKNAELAAEAAARQEAERNLPPEKRGLLHYDREYFDPEDEPFMEQMLKDALEQMQKNPKYVLASMPLSFKVPLLREWIRHRYGKRYTREELLKDFKRSLNIFRALEKISLQVRLPNAKQLGGKFFVDYSCRNYLLKKSNFIKAEYYKRLNASIMEQARVFWFAMRPYMCVSGPPRNTYFAYMPAAVKDILHFRIWKPNEFMNAKGEWDRRQSQKARRGRR